MDSKAPKAHVMTPGQAAIMPAKAGKVEVESRTEVAQAAEVRRLAQGIIVSTGELAGKYLALCLYVRANKIPEKTVSREMAALGFKRSRISEVNRVCQASDKLFAQYQSKMIGFGKALEFARMEDGKGLVMTPAASLLAEKNLVNQDDVDSIAAAESQPREASAASKTPMAAKIKASAKFIAVNATRAATYSFADARFRVIVELVPKTKPAIGD